MISGDEASSLLERLIGFRAEPTRAEDVARAFRERLRARGCRDVRAYARLLEEPLTRAAETQALADRLTVNETYFLRETAQLDVIVDELVPALIARGISPVRILSVGCSTGEEPYGLALRLLEAAVPPNQVELLGVDVSPHVLAHARRAEYSEWALRNMPAPLRACYFERQQRSFRLVERVRQRVRFEQLNLVDQAAPFWESERFEIVLCRNLLIYLTPEAISLAVARFARVLTAPGALFLGHAETALAGPHFELEERGRAFYFRRRGAAAANPRTARAQGQGTAAEQLLEPIESSSARVRQLEAVASALTSNPRPADREGADEESEILQLIHQERFDDALVRVGAGEVDERSERWLLRAVILTNLGQTEEATRAARARLQQLPACPFAHFLLGVCSEASRRLDEAQQLYERAAGLAPTFALARLRAGMLARRAGQHARARRALQAALDVFPHQAARTQVLYGGGFTREAMAALCRAELSALGGRA